MASIVLLNRALLHLIIGEVSSYAGRNAVLVELQLPKNRTNQHARVLYITYDGLTDPLGRSQILPYLIALTRRGHFITILSCEKGQRMDKDGAQIRKLCAEEGIQWVHLRYHKSPPILSSLWDWRAMRRAAVRLQRQQQFDLVHCRSYIPASVGLHLKRLFGIKFLFDMRGFWPDEKVEGNNWNMRNPAYRLVYHHFKRLEAKLLSSADCLISLTQAGKTQLLTRPELSGRDDAITVIPCCVDFDHFPLATDDSRSAARQFLGLQSDAAVLLYLGSIGSWYMLDEMLDFFREFAQSDTEAKFLFITPDSPAHIRNSAISRGLDPASLVMIAASREEVPRLMAAADLGIFFIAPVFSKTASSPTKMGEMLAVGLPIIANTGVGDVERILEDTGCGITFSDFSPASYRKAISHFQKTNWDLSKCRNGGRRWFDLDVGVASYDHVYRSMLSDEHRNGNPSATAS